MLSAFGHASVFSGIFRTSLQTWILDIERRQTNQLQKIERPAAFLQRREDYIALRLGAWRIPLNRIKVHSFDPSSDTHTKTKLDTQMAVVHLRNREKRLGGENYQSEYFLVDGLVTIDETLFRGSIPTSLLLSQHS